MLPLLALTPGEPAGIGPDLVCMLTPTTLNANLLLIADPQLIHARARILHLSVTTNILNPGQPIPPQVQPGRLNIFPVALGTPVKPGRLDINNASYVLETLKQATRLCEQNICQGMVTGPVQKSIIIEAGFPFTGHTEWLAARTKTHQVVMMLATPDLKVALATTHLPLKDVADAIQFDRLVTSLRIIHQDMSSRFGIAKPRILVCGLNPHAGENGQLGREEIDILIPALAAARGLGLLVTGPMAADTAFTQRQLAQADVVLAMYHDQGLPVLKSHSFGKGVNITLGLPVIRTSVDHGTALDLAGTPSAEASSLIAAITLAANMALSQQRS